MYDMWLQEEWVIAEIITLPVGLLVIKSNFIIHSSKDITNIKLNNDDQEILHVKKNKYYVYPYREMMSCYI